MCTPPTHYPAEPLWRSLSSPNEGLRIHPRGEVQPVPSRAATSGPPKHWHAGHVQQRLATVQHDLKWIVRTITPAHLAALQPFRHSKRSARPFSCPDEEQLQDSLQHCLKSRCSSISQNAVQVELARFARSLDETELCSQHAVGVALCEGCLA